MNKRVIEALIKAGALDSFGRRSQLMAVIDRAIERAQKAQRDHEQGQHGLFGIFHEQAAAAGRGDELPALPDWEEAQRLASEKEVLGFFVSGHPLDRYAEKLRNLNAVDTATALETRPAPAPRRGQGGAENEILMAGVLVGVRAAKSKRSGEMYAQGALEDTVGRIDIIVFPRDYQRLAEQLRMEVPVLVRGQLRAEEEAAPKLAVSSIQSLEEARVRLPGSVRIRVPLERATDELLVALKGLVDAAPGPGHLMMTLEQRGEFSVMLEPRAAAVAADRAFVDRVEQLLGRGSVQAID
jgi:DNA polymerase-3 subunit alpha